MFNPIKEYRSRKVRRFLAKLNKGCKFTNEVNLADADTAANLTASAETKSNDDFEILIITRYVKDNSVFDQFYTGFDTFLETMEKQMNEDKAYSYMRAHATRLPKQ